MDKKIFLENLERIYGELLKLETEIKRINKVEQFDYCTSSRLQRASDIKNIVDNINKIVYQEE